MFFNFRKIFYIVLFIIFLAVIHEKVLIAVGSALIVEDIPKKADAAVVLNTGVDIYPRLIEAADLYRNVRVDRVVINGNRKTDTLRDLENSGYEPSQKWYTELISILNYKKVPKDHILAISAEDAFDTISEAKIVGDILINNGMKDIVITTSKFHSRRARYIWRKMYKGRLNIYIASAKKDPFTPKKWWKYPRQIRWVFSEYGAWFYYHLTRLID
jgi:uncharacterized SAM-binding protein YcdF (DUF218 family)